MPNRTAVDIAPAPARARRRLAFLLGPDARWITGTDLVVDGGTIKAA